MRRIPALFEDWVRKVRVGPASMDCAQLRHRNLVGRVAVVSPTPLAGRPPVPDIGVVLRVTKILLIFRRDIVLKQNLPLLGICSAISERVRHTGENRDSSGLILIFISRM